MAQETSPQEIMIRAIQTRAPYRYSRMLPGISKPQ